MVCTCDNVCLKVVGRKPDEHGGTLWPQSPRIDLPRAGATREAMVMLTERWRKLLRCSHAALFEVPSSGIFDPRDGNRDRGNEGVPRLTEHGREV